MLKPTRNKKAKQGILTGASFNLKKMRANARRLTATVKGAPLLANGMLDTTFKCSFNSPFLPANRHDDIVEKGTQKVFNLLARFKV